MKNKQNTSRRGFIKKGIIASSIMILPRHVLGGPGYLAPSDKLNLAAIGSGGKGASDISNASVKGREHVSALCDVDFSGTASKTAKKFPKAKKYADYRIMLEKEKDIDAVTISTPDHIHGPAAAYAMERGIHVYVQKPMTHNIKEARILTEMAREKRVVTQMGNQGGSNPLLNMVQNWIDNDSIGAVSEVKIWTNRPVWPQGVQMPKSDSSLKPDALNWDVSSTSTSWFGDQYHENLLKSTRLTRQKRNYVDMTDMPGRIQTMYRRMIPHYKHLHQYRITPKKK